MYIRLCDFLHCSLRGATALPVVLSPCLYKSNRKAQQKAQESWMNRLFLRKPFTPTSTAAAQNGDRKVFLIYVHKLLFMCGCCCCSLIHISSITAYASTVNRKKWSNLHCWSVYQSSVTELFIVNSLNTLNLVWSCKWRGWDNTQIPTSIQKIQNTKAEGCSQASTTTTNVSSPPHDHTHTRCAMSSTHTNHLDEIVADGTIWLLGVK